MSSQCGERSNHGLLGYVRKQVPTFQCNLLPPPSGSTMKLKGPRSLKTLIHIYKSPHHHILVAHSLALVLFMEVIRVPTSEMIKEFSCITAISWQVTNVHQITYLDRKNGNSSKERVVAIRMYAKLKPNKIPTARVNMNVFPTAGLNSPETIKSKFKAQWLLYLPSISTLKTPTFFTHSVFLALHNPYHQQWLLP